MIVTGTPTAYHGIGCRLLPNDIYLSETTETGRPEMHASVAGTTEVFGRGSARVPRALGAVAVIGLALAAWALAHGPTTTAPTAPIKAMTAECHQAYRGYMEATDAAEADFWAESWMAFGCESGGYWA